MDTIEQIVIAAARNVVHDQHAEFPPHAPIDAVAKDSIDEVSLLFELEDTLGFDIPVDALVGIQTVGDLIEKLESLKQVAMHKQAPK